MSSVVATDECPRRAAFAWIPALRTRIAWVWRSWCRVSGGRPTSLRLSVAVGISSRIGRGGWGCRLRERIRGPGSSMPHYQGFPPGRVGHRKVRFEVPSEARALHQVDSPTTCSTPRPINAAHCCTTRSGSRSARTPSSPPSGDLKPPGSHPDRTERQRPTDPRLLSSFRTVPASSQRSRLRNCRILRPGRGGHRTVPLRR